MKIIAAITSKAIMAVKMACARGEEAVINNTVIKKSVAESQQAFFIAACWLLCALFYLT